MNAVMSSPSVEVERTASSGGTWFLQALTGVLLVILLGVHMVANHFIVAGGLRTYADVVAYLKNAFVFGWEIVFLAAVTWHALLGARTIVFDFGLGPQVERRVNVALTVIGVLTFAYGVWLSVRIVL
jgi:succinate dehydrogenase / fumarate reductase membrane anchor subunit